MTFATKTTATLFGNRGILAIVDFGNRGYLILSNRWLVTVDTIVFLMGQSISTLLRSHRKGILNNT